MVKRLPPRPAQNKGAGLPPLASKSSGSGTTGVFDQILNPNQNSISRQPPAQPQQSSAGVPASNLGSAAPHTPMPPLSQFSNHRPPHGLPQMPSGPVALGMVCYPSLQGPPLDQGQRKDWTAVYNETYSQVLQSCQSKQQGFNMPLRVAPPLSTNAPVAGPSYSNTEAQPPVPLPGEVIDLTAHGDDENFSNLTVRAPVVPPPGTFLGAGYQPTIQNAHVPAVPLNVHMPGQNVSDYQAPYASQGQPSLHAFSHEGYYEGNTIGAASSVGDRVSPLLAPAPVRPHMLHQVFNRSFTRDVSEPSESLADARAGKRRRDTAEEIFGISGEERSYQVKTLCRRAQSTAEDAHANSERAASAVAVELERRSREEACEAPSAESRREEVLEEGAQGDGKVNEAQGSDHDQGEHSLGDRKDSGFHEQNSNGEEGDSEETAEPEPADQGDQGDPGNDTVTPEDEFFDLLNLGMYE